MTNAKPYWVRTIETMWLGEAQAARTVLRVAVKQVPVKPRRAVGHILSRVVRRMRQIQVADRQAGRRRLRERPYDAEDYAGARYREEMEAR